MADTGNQDPTMKSFLDDLASIEPTPGGGSVSALSGALGASLITMVAKISLKPKDLEADLRSEFEEIINITEDARRQFEVMVADDADAYNSVIEAYRLPKDTDETRAIRTEAIQKAFKRAAEVPMTILEKAYELAPRAIFIAEKGNVNCLSDSAVAIQMLGAAVHGASLNVMINLKYIKDEDYNNSMLDKLRKNKGEAENILADAGNIISERFK
jgi:formiminotetrahydrofolate cyclodeaminase